MKKYYYAINFYGQDHALDKSFYIKSEKELSIQGVKETLKTDFVGVDDLTLEDIQNVDSVFKISAEEFTDCCGISA